MINVQDERIVRGMIGLIQIPQYYPPVVGASDKLGTRRLRRPAKKRHAGYTPAVALQDAL